MFSEALGCFLGALFFKIKFFNGRLGESSFDMLFLDFLWFVCGLPILLFLHVVFSMC